MLSLLNLFNTIVLTYTNSLKKDLAKQGFEIILLIVSIAWVDLIVLAGVYFSGWFKMPSDPLFYLFWSGVTFVYTIQFTFFIIGLKHSVFLAANALPSVGFVVTTLYAVIFLQERLSFLQIGAVVLAVVGSMLFFDWKSRTHVNNKGLLIILFSLVLSPFINIMYKAASIHTDSFSQFLTGRLVMDFVYYSLIFFLMFAFWYRKNPWPNTIKFFQSGKGWVYMILLVLVSLLDSWLIFLMPISLFTMLRTISVPTGYMVGNMKYKERIEARFVFGGIFIVAGVILFALEGK